MINQRLKFFNRHLWNVLKLCYKLYEFENVKHYIDRGFELAYQRHALSYKQYLISVAIKVFQQEIERIHRESRQFLEKTVEKTKRIESTRSENVTELLKIWRQTIDQNMHVDIYNEVVDCLTSKKHLVILENLVYLGLYNHSACGIEAVRKHLNSRQVVTLFNTFDNKNIDASDNEIKRYFSTLAVLNKQELEGLFSFIRDDILETIAFTPWYEGFTKLL